VPDNRSDQARKPEGRPLQKRALEKRNRIVAALGRMLKTMKFDDVTMPALAKEAGVAVGTIYQRFENKEALIPVIFELYEQRLIDFLAEDGRVEIEPDAGLKPAIERIVYTAWAFTENEGHLLRATVLFARQRPDLMGDKWNGFIEQARQSAIQLMALFPEEVKVEEPDRAAAFLAYQLNLLPLEYGLFREDGIGALYTHGDEAFLKDVSRAIYAYLTFPVDR
jgi:AcrR family transcriptional regulator